MIALSNNMVSVQVVLEELFNLFLGGRDIVRDYLSEFVLADYNRGVVIIGYSATLAISNALLAWTLFQHVRDNGTVLRITVTLFLFHIWVVNFYEEPSTLWNMLGQRLPVSLLGNVSFNVFKMCIENWQTLLGAIEPVIDTILISFLIMFYSCWEYIWLGIQQMHEYCKERFGFVPVP